MSQSLTYLISHNSIKHVLQKVLTHRHLDSGTNTHTYHSFPICIIIYKNLYNRKFAKNNEF